MKRAPSPLDYAYRLLSIKDRTAKEMAGRLREKGFDEPGSKEVLDHLMASGLINDRRYAVEWVKKSSAIKPKGVFAIKKELEKKGLTEDFINAALESAEAGYDELDVASALAGSRLEKLKQKNRNEQRKSVYDHLARRGFSFDVINDILEKI